MAILDRNGRPITSARKTGRTPVPSAPQYSSTRSYIADGITPEKLGPMFRDADRGDVSKQSELFEMLLERDCHVLSEYTKRVNAITNHRIDWQLTPASDSQRDMDVVDFIEEHLLNHMDFTKYRKVQQMAVGHGFSAIAPEWDQSSGQAVIKRFVDQGDDDKYTVGLVEHKRITFVDPKTGLLRNWPLLITDDHPQGIEVQRESLILHRSEGLGSHASRIGVFRPVTWMVVFKHFSIKDWWTFSELCGIPLRIGYYDSTSTDDDRKTLERGLQGLGVDFYALLSKNTEIEFREAAKTVTGPGLWEQQGSFCNNEISKAVIGSSAFSEAGSSGNYALRTLDGVREDLALSDAQECAATDNYQVIAPMVLANFGPETKLPRLEAVYKKQDDLETKSKWLEPFADRAGDQISLDWYMRQYGAPALQDDDQTVGSLRKKAAPSNELAAKLVRAKAGIAKKAKAYSPEQQALEDHADALVARVNLDDNEEAMLDFVASYTGEIEDLPGAMLAVWDDLDMESLRTNMELGLNNASLHGRRVVQIQKEGVE